MLSSAFCCCSKHPTCGPTRLNSAVAAAIEQARKNPEALEAHLAAFWHEYGLTGSQAGYVASELIGAQHPCCNVSYCATHLARMARVLPGVDFP